MIRLGPLCNLSLLIAEHNHQSDSFPYSQDPPTFKGTLIKDEGHGKGHLSILLTTQENPENCDMVG